MKFSFVGLRRWWFGLSALMIGASIVALAVFGLRPSIDFVGGSLMEVAFVNATPSSADLTAALPEARHKSIRVQ